MFATIVEKVEEEEKEGQELEQLSPSENSDFYFALTFKGRQSWPTFLGDWAYSNGANDLNASNDQSKIKFTFPALGPLSVCRLLLGV